MKTATNRPKSDGNHLDTTLVVVSCPARKIRRKCHFRAIIDSYRRVPCPSQPVRRAPCLECFETCFCSSPFYHVTSCKYPKIRYLKSSNVVETLIWPVAESLADQLTKGDEPVFGRGP